MRKITILFSLVCAFLLGVTATAQTITIASVTRVSEIEEGKWYVMQLESSNPSYLYEQSNHNLKRKGQETETASSLDGATVNDDVKASLVRFSINDDNTYSIRLATGRYFPQLTSDGQITTSLDNIGKYYMKKLTDGTDTYFQFGSKSPDVTTNSNTSYLIDGGNSRGSNVTSWHNVYKSGYESGAGDIWGIYEVKVNYTVGNATVSSSFEDLRDNNRWVAMYTGNARMYVYKEGETRGYPAIDNATFMKLDENHFWGFICNDPISDASVYIVNEGAGEGNYLKMTADAVNSPCVMGDGSERAKWTFEQATSTGKYDDGDSNYFGIKCVGTTKYINNYNGNGFMTSWTENAGTDTGTGIKFVSILDTYKTLAERALTAPEGAVHSLKTTCREKIGDVAGIAGKTLEELQGIVRTHQDEEHGIIPMEDNGYYRILNYHEHDASPQVISFSGTNRALAAQDNNNADQIWKAQYVSNSNNELKYSFQNANMTKYLNQANSGGLNETPVTYTLTDLGAGQHFFVSGGVLVGTLNNNALSGIGNVATNVRHRKNTKDAWYLMPATELEVTLHKGDSGNDDESNIDRYYATAYFPFAIRMEEGTDAYIMDGYSDEDKTINLRKVNGVIPANTGLVLVKTQEAQENSATQVMSKVYILTESPASIDNNKLKGTNTEVAINDETRGDYLVLGKGSSSGKVGFYKPSAVAAKIRSNSAYLLVSDLGKSAVNGLNFNFGGTVDSIQGVENADNGRSDVIYDLQGRRVNAPARKGIYIINGKKIIR